MNRKYLITLAISALCLAGFWAWTYAPLASPASLATRALSANRPEDRELAVAELTMLKDPEVKVQLLRVAKESTDPKTLVLAINKIGSDGHLNDERLELMLTCMGNPEKAVRNAALNALVKRFGNPLPDNLEYAPDDSADTRVSLAAKLRGIVDKQKQAAADWNRKLADSTGGKAAPAPTPVDPAAEPSSPPSPPPAPSVTAASSPPAPSVAPLPPTAAPALVSQADYPGITMVVWICRALAVLVLLAEVVGALSMIFGEMRVAVVPKNQAALTPAQTADVLFRNSVASWLKVGVLVAGAIGIVALLATSEMLLHAVRVEQRLDYLSRSR